MIQVGVRTGYDLSTKAGREALWLAEQRALTARIAGAQAHVSALFDRQERAVLANLLAEGAVIFAGHGRLWRVADSFRRRRTHELAAAQSLLPGEPWIEEFAQLHGEESRMALEAMLGRLGQQLSVDLSDQIRGPAIATYLRDRSFASAGAIHETTLRQLRYALALAFKNGDGPDQFAGAVASIYEEAKGHRSLRIARTEMASAAEFGRFQGMRASDELLAQSGKQVRLMWVSARDDRVRDTHRRLDGKTVALGETFQVGASQMKHPLDSSMGAPAKEIVHCRCIAAPVVGKRKAAQAPPISIQPPNAPAPGLAEIPVAGSEPSIAIGVKPDLSTPAAPVKLEPPIKLPGGRVPKFGGPRYPFGQADIAGNWTAGELAKLNATAEVQEIGRVLVEQVYREAKDAGLEPESTAIQALNEWLAGKRPGPEMPKFTITHITPLGTGAKQYGNLTAVTSDHHERLKLLLAQVDPDPQAVIDGLAEALDVPPGVIKGIDFSSHKARRMGALGYWDDETGVMGIDPGVTGALQAFVEDIAKRTPLPVLNRGGLDAFSTFVHEFYHVASPARSTMDYDTLRGFFLEEGLVEFRTRRLLSRLTDRGDYGWMYSGGPGPYGEETAAFRALHSWGGDEWLERVWEGGTDAARAGQIDEFMSDWMTRLMRKHDFDEAEVLYAGQRLKDGESWRRLLDGWVWEQDPDVPVDQIQDRLRAMVAELIRTDPAGAGAADLLEEAVASKVVGKAKLQPATQATAPVRPPFTLAGGKPPTLYYGGKSISQSAQAGAWVHSSLSKLGAPAEVLESASFLAKDVFETLTSHFGKTAKEAMDDALGLVNEYLAGRRPAPVLPAASHVLPGGGAVAGTPSNLGLLTADVHRRIGDRIMAEAKGKQHRVFQIIQEELGVVEEYRINLYSPEADRRGALGLHSDAGIISFDSRTSKDFETYFMTEVKKGTPWEQMHPRSTNSLATIIHEFHHAASPSKGRLEYTTKMGHFIEEGLVEFRSRQILSRLNGKDYSWEPMLSQQAYEDETFSFRALHSWGGDEAIDAIWAGGSAAERRRLIGDWMRGWLEQMLRDEEVRGFFEEDVVRKALYQMSDGRAWERLKAHWVWTRQVWEKAPADDKLRRLRGMLWLLDRGKMSQWE